MKETSECTVCVRSKIENATNLQKLIAYQNHQGHV